MRIAGRDERCAGAPRKSTGLAADAGPRLPRLRRPWSRVVAVAAVGAMTLSSVARNLFGWLPVLRSQLSPTGTGPRLAARTAASFRVLLLWRWIARRNDVGRGLAAFYVRSALAEVATRGAAPSEPVRAVSSHDELPAAIEDWRRRPEPVVFRGLDVPKRDWSLRALVDEFGATRLLVSHARGFELQPLRVLALPAGAGGYVANSERLLAEHPEILEALDVGAWRPRLGMHPYCVQLFLGAEPRRGLTYHCANNVNLFFMLHGRKRWTFVDPAFSYFMYPWCTGESAYVASIVNHRDIPPEQFALYDACPRQEVVLEPGDVLLNPPWWWHEVENLDAGTVGCATRWAGPGVRDTNRLFSFAQSLSPRSWSATADVLTALLEAGGDLRRFYRAQAGSGITRIEGVSHTREQHEPGAAGIRGWPVPSRARRPEAATVARRD